MNTEHDEKWNEFIYTIKPQQTESEFIRSNNNKWKRNISTMFVHILQLARSRYRTFRQTFHSQFFYIAYGTIVYVSVSELSGTRTKSKQLSYRLIIINILINFDSSRKLRFWIFLGVFLWAFSFQQLLKWMVICLSEVELKWFVCSEFDRRSSVTIMINSNGIHPIELSKNIFNFFIQIFCETQHLTHFCAN